MEQKKIIWNAISLLNNVVNDVDRCPPPVRCCSPNPPFLLWYVFFCLFFLVFWRISLALIPLTCTGDRFGPASGDAQQDLNRKKRVEKNGNLGWTKLLQRRNESPFNGMNGVETKEQQQQRDRDMRWIWHGVCDCVWSVCVLQKSHMEPSKQERKNWRKNEWVPEMARNHSGHTYLLHNSMASADELPDACCTDNINNNNNCKKKALINAKAMCLLLKLDTYINIV